MDSVDKLRDKSLKFAPNIRRDVNMALNEIEREIEHDYMRLPVDADGVPIHVGDTLVLPSEYAGRWTVDKLAFDGQDWYFESSGDYLDCAGWTHYHKPTVEDVLRGVVTLCANTWRGGMSCFSHYTVDDVMDSGNMRDFSDELREVLRDE